MKKVEFYPVLRNYCLYVHTCKFPDKNGIYKKYFGITSMIPNERWGRGSGYRKNKHFYRTILKYGWDSFEHIILHDYLTEWEAEELEKLFIAHYKTYDKKYGFNKTMGGESGKIMTNEVRKKMSESRKGKYTGENSPHYGKHLSEGHKRKISESLRGKYIGEKSPNWSKTPSQETRDKISIALKGKMIGDKNPMYGYKFSEKQCKRMSESHKGFKHSEESKLKMSIAQKGKIVSQETRDKLRQANIGKFSGDKNPMYGKHHTEETKKLISLHKIGTQANGNNPRAVKVICLNDDNVFDTIKQCAKYYGLHRDSVKRNCNHQYLKSKYNFMYDIEYQFLCLLLTTKIKIYID